MFVSLTKANPGLRINDAIISHRLRNRHVALAHRKYGTHYKKKIPKYKPRHIKQMKLKIRYLLKDMITDKEAYMLNRPKQFSLRETLPIITRIFEHFKTNENALFACAQLLSRTTIARITKKQHPRYFRLEIFS